LWQKTSRHSIPGCARLWLLVAWLPACSILYPAPKPIPSINYAARQGSKTLLVLLPGRSDTAADFAKQGFIHIAQDSGVPTDIVAVDARFGYYVSETLSRRLAEDVIAPAKSRGTTSFWLSGVSMGGLGAMIYAEQNPGEVDGVLAIAPFLGDDDVIKEIELAGGLSRWKTIGKAKPGDYQRELWLWLGRCLPRAPGCPRIYLGFGKSDRFVRAHRLLAAELPSEQVVEVPGGHDWAPWREIFTAALPRMFPGSPPAKTP
jgi:pimeloyl-ACP methyl ester carboxylesterase